MIQVSVMFALLCVLGIIGWIKGMPAEIQYLLTLENSQEVGVRLKPRLDGKVDVKGVTTDYKETIPLETFFNERNWRPKPVLSRELLPIIIVGSVPLLLMLAFVAFVVWQKRKDASLRQSLRVHSANSPPTQEETEA